MGDEVKASVLKQAVEALISRIEKTEKFVLSEAPELCKQIIMEEKIKAFFSVGMNFLTSTVCFALTYLGYYLFHLGHGSGGYQFSGVMVGIFSGIGAVVFGLDFVQSFKEIIIITNCPKLVLVREFSKLLKRL